MNRVLLIGSPNSGKSSLFNRLTGLNQRVANFPGITVDVASGPFAGMPDVELVDFPGTYSLQPISGEEAVAVEFFQRALTDPEVRHVLCVVDATRLEKSLYFTLQVIRECQKRGKPVSVLANMADVLAVNDLAFDHAGLADAIGAPVLLVSARQGLGIDLLLSELRQKLISQPAVSSRWSETPDELLRGSAHQLAQRFGPRGDVLVQSQLRLDSFFLNTGLGGGRFFLHHVFAVPIDLYLVGAGDGRRRNRSHGDGRHTGASYIQSSHC